MHHVAETAGTGHGRRSTEAGGEGLGEERADVSDPMQGRTLPTHGGSAHKAGTFAPLHAAEGASPEPRASASVLGCLTALDYPLHGGDGGKGAVVKYCAGAINVRACVRAFVHAPLSRADGGVGRRRAEDKRLAGTTCVFAPCVGTCCQELKPANIQAFKIQAVAKNSSSQEFKNPYLFSAPRHSILVSPTAALSPIGNRNPSGNEPYPPLATLRLPTAQIYPVKPTPHRV